MIPVSIKTLCLICTRYMLLASKS